MVIHPREVFADPLSDRTTAVIIAHNHPSGDVTPSDDDRRVTREVQKAGQTLGLQLLDHTILNHDAHYSFLEHGEI